MKRTLPIALFLLAVVSMAASAVKHGSDWRSKDVDHITVEHGVDPLNPNNTIWWIVRWDEQTSQKGKPVGGATLGLDDDGEEGITSAPAAEGPNGETFRVRRGKVSIKKTSAGQKVWYRMKGWSAPKGTV